MTTYHIHATLGPMFEDLYVKARTKAEAIEKARKMLRGTAMDSRWTNYAA